MAVLIENKYEVIQQAVMWPRYEWTWRGIVNPGIWDPNWNTNVCITDIGTDGTYYIYDSNTVGMGSANPNQTISDIFFYAFKCDAGGNFYIQWGDAGNEQLTDVSRILVYDKGVTTADVAEWDDVDKRYEFINKTWSDKVIAEYDLGVRDLCFSMEILPSLFIDYSFTEVLVGGVE